MYSVSYWERTSYFAPSDIVIVGAGLMCLWCAWEIKQKAPNLRITILERNPTPLGASTRNAGFACFGSLTELLSDEAAIGTDAMLSIVEMRFKGIQKIKQIFTVSEIDYDPCGGYEAILSNNPVFTNLADKINYINTLLFPILNTNAFDIATDKISALGLKNFDALIINTCEAGLHSGKLVQALSRKLVEKGVQILYGTSVKTYQSNPTEITITLDNNIELQTNKLLFTTNAFTNTLIEKDMITPGRGQILLTHPIPNLQTIGTFHFDEGFYYWRNIGDRILLGGGRNTNFEQEQTTNLEGSDQIRKVLTQFLQTHFNYDTPIEYSWSGIMGFTSDKKPILQKLQDHVFVATACNGMGVALSPVWAEKVATTIL